jgi:hypothetical protein
MIAISEYLLNERILLSESQHFRLKSSIFHTHKNIILYTEKGKITTHLKENRNCLRERPDGWPGSKGL